MQNIDPVYVIQPLVMTALAIALVVYWRKRRGFTKWMLLYSFAAYALAILAKTVFQLFTAGMIAPISTPYVLAAYYGLQTMVLEVGLAYLFASYAIKRRQMSGGDAWGYGIGLAFWENGVLLGALPLINLAATYLLLASGGSVAGLTYSTLASAQPSLFYPVAQALPLVGLGILERASSIMIHVAWGFLAVTAAFYRKWRYLAIALPMGLVDALVPFAGTLGVPVFEAVIFAISLAALLAAVWVGRNLNKKRRRWS